MFGDEEVKPLLKLPLLPAVLHRALPMPGKACLRISYYPQSLSDPMTANTSSGIC